MPHTLPLEIQQLLATSISQSKDGYAILDSNDKFIYANNFIVNSVFGSPPDSILGTTFSEVIKNCFQHKYGVNIETNDIEHWILEANKKRWKYPFRSFNIDLVDGRWFLLTEQIIQENYLFVHATEITRTKLIEEELLFAKQKLTTLAFVDELTEIANRRRFMERLEEELCKAKRTTNSLHLFLFDVDYFKSINDQHGHQAGDLVLTQLAVLVSSELRKYDIFARVGGEEFAILFTDTSLNKVHSIVERIRKSIENSKFQYENKSISITVSFGGTTSKSKDNNSSIMKRADDALYQAKNAGRNRTSFSE